MNSLDNCTINDLFHELNRFITIQSGDREKYMNHLNIIEKRICDDLIQRSGLFKKMCHGFDYSGSYRDNLKVKKPDEYDLNFKMKFPVKSDKVKVTGASAGFLKINVKEFLNEIKTLTGYDKMEKELSKLTDSEGYLLQTKWMAWSESVFSLSFEKVKEDLSAEYSMGRSKHGPAHTIDVTCISDRTVRFSIDFVFSITFDLTKWIADRRIPQMAREKNEYFMAIPKPNKNLVGQDNQMWIASYPVQDHCIIHNKNRLKDAIRFLKKIRDTQGIENLKSFFIKTVVMLETDRRYPGYWDNSLQTVLTDMLGAVILCLKKGSIPSYWNKNFDIIECLSEAQRQDMVRKLEKVKRIWESSLDKRKIISTILSSSETDILMATRFSSAPRIVLYHEPDNSEHWVTPENSEASTSSNFNSRNVLTGIGVLAVNFKELFLLHLSLR